MAESQGMKSAKARSFIIGILLLAMLLVWVIGLNEIIGYLDCPSFAIVFGFTIGLLLIGSGLDNLVKSIFYSVTGKITSIEGAHAAIVSCGLAAWAALIGGVVGTLIGVINILGSGVDYYNKDVGDGVAFALTTTLYGIIIAGLFLALRARIIQALYRQQNKMGEGGILLP